ncbi:MAG: V-type H(+)-translocating pyrophosphatase [Planctomycetes bacterium]|nr:V-type H(+)-translocating pyrophosphatase [Planctomycetota bacterium]
MTLPIYWYLAPIGAIAALIMAVFFYKGFMTSSEGDPEMVRIAQAVREGAYAYLAAQRKVVIMVFICLMIILAIMGFALQLQDELTFIGVGIAGFLSGLCGYFGMKTATNASARTAFAAKNSLNDGLRVAFRAGAVMGLCVTGFALLDVSVWFFLLTQVFGYHDLVAVTTITLSFAMGASLQALFARVGGGIYTKAADVGADLVGKVEAGIPEDDARNPATIADNVGDNVGDVAGMGADLYESYYGSILAAMALAAAAAFRLASSKTGAWADFNLEHAIHLVATPAALAGLGIIASVLSIFLVRTKEGASMGELLKSLHTGVWASSGLIIAGSAGLLYALLHDVPGVSWIGIWVAIMSGLIAGLVIAWGTELYTSYEHKPTQRISEQAQTGPATVIISGIAEGMISTWIPMLTTVAAILIAFIAAGGQEVFLLGVFGVAIAAVGMLSTLAITLATDAYGPIADNAGGNAEMTHQPKFVRERTDMLDSLGNTTAATGKGFAIGSAALTALALLAAYVITVQTTVNTQMLHSDFVTSGAAEKALVDTAAVYHDHGIFVVKSDKGLEAGMLLSPEKRVAIEAAVAAGQTVKAEYDADLGIYHAQVVGSKTRLQFEIAPASSASIPQILTFYDVTLLNPRALCGLFIGVMMVFVFCAMTMNAVGRAAYRMMLECRRQFGIMKAAFKKDGMSDADIADPMKWPFEVTVDGHAYPDYANCVAISTQGSLKEMMVPSLMAVVVPIVVGLILGVPGVMGMLAGALVCGFAVAIFMANAGGAWDNAKKYIETGQYGGKGSLAHKAGVVGDTVGDPFKDTSGPSLNILIKLISVVSVVFAGLIVKLAPMISDLLHLG